MTRKRDLKRLVRDRQARTGESYVTALRHVRARSEPAFPVLELADHTETAATLGMQCRVSVHPGVADPPRVLAKLREVLLATTTDRALDLLRGVVLEGVRPTAELFRSAAPMQRFLARVRAGIGGVSDNGSMLALTIDGELVLFLAWLVPRPFASRVPPSLIVTTADGTGAHPVFGWDETLRASP
jgi:hypothetical protein